MYIKINKESNPPFRLVVPIVLMPGNAAAAARMGDNEVVYAGTVASGGATTKHVVTTMSQVSSGAAHVHTLENLVALVHMRTYLRTRINEYFICQM